MQLGHRSVLSGCIGLHVCLASGALRGVVWEWGGGGGQGPREAVKWSFSGPRGPGYHPHQSLLKETVWWKEREAIHPFPPLCPATHSPPACSSLFQDKTVISFTGRDTAFRVQMAFESFVLLFYNVVCVRKDTYPVSLLAIIKWPTDFLIVDCALLHGCYRFWLYYTTTLVNAWLWLAGKCCYAT